MKIPADLGIKTEDPLKYVSLTFRHISNKLGPDAEEIVNWLEKEHPKKYNDLVLNPEVEKNWRETKDINQLKSDLHRFYKYWISVKKMWGKSANK